MNPMHRFRPLLSAALAGVLCMSLGACDQLLEQLQSSHVAMATLIKTPDLKNPLTDDTVPGVTTFTLHFGSVRSERVLPLGTGGQRVEDDAFSPIGDAVVRLQFTDTTQTPPLERDITVPSRGGGRYVIDSSEARQLAYVEGEYVATVEYAGQTFRLKVTTPSAGQSRIAELEATGAKVITDHAPGAPLTLTRADARGASENPIGIVALQSVSGVSASERYTNLPQNAIGLLRFVLADGPWRADSFQIPGENFEQGASYLVTLSALERGAQDTSGGARALFPASVFLAGVADGGGVMTASAP